MTTDLEGLSTEQLRELLRDGDCWGVADPDRFFPPESKPPQTPSGIWGGTAPWQRRQILATRHAARTSTERAAAVTRVQQVAYPERRAS